MIECVRTLVAGWWPLASEVAEGRGAGVCRPEEDKVVISLPTLICDRGASGHARAPVATCTRRMLADAATERLERNQRLSIYALRRPAHYP